VLQAKKIFVALACLDPLMANFFFLKKKLVEKVIITRFS